MTEHELPFLSDLRAELRRAAILHTRTRPAPRRRSFRAWKLVPVLILVFVTAAVAATVLSQPTPTVLVSDGLECVQGTNNTHASTYAGGVEQDGSTPTAACAEVLKLAPSRLVACYNARFGVVVYESTGAKNQCADVKMRPLPVGYAAATDRVYRLQLALNRLYASQDCISPTKLASESQELLNRSGFVGWATELLVAHGQNSTGPCGTFPALGNSQSDATAALNGRRHVVEIYNGPSRSVFRDIELTTPLMTETGSKCFTTRALEKQIEALYKPIGLPVRFAITQLSRGAEFSGARQTRYAQSCSIFASALTAPDGRTILAWLNNRNAQPLPYPGPGAPSTASYKPST